MHQYNYIIEKCPDTNSFVGHVPGVPGAHSQGQSLDELAYNMKEVLEMLSEDGEIQLESEFIGVQSVSV